MALETSHPSFAQTDERARSCLHRTPQIYNNDCSQLMVYRSMGFLSLDFLLLRILFSPQNNENLQNVVMYQNALYSQTLSVRK